MRRQSGIAVRQSLLHLMTGLASSLLLMAGLMYLVERSGSKVNLSLVFESLKAISLEVLLLYTLVVVANTLARAYVTVCWWMPGSASQKRVSLLY